MADAGQLVVYLSLLCAKLDVVGKRLPFAASAGAEVAAERVLTLGRRLVATYYLALEKTAFLACQAYVDYVTGNSEFYEQYTSWRFRVVAFEAGVRYFAG